MLATIVGMVDIDVARDRVRRAADMIQAHDLLREGLLKERDKCLADARDAGARWVDLQEDARLSPRALQMALNRAKEDSGEK